MTEISQNNPSDSTAPYEIAALEAQLASNPKNPSLHAHLAWAYLEAGRFDEAIETNKICYNLNIKDGDKIHAAKAAGEMGHCFFKRSWTARNSDPNKAQDWLNGMKWKKQQYNLISTLINSDPRKKHDLARIADEVGQEYLDASQRLRQANSKQADEYWLKGIKWKKKSWNFDEKLSWTDQRTIKHTIENCAKTAGYIGEEYLKASTRLRGANPEQAEKYWLEGMVWKEKAYGSYKELSHTDSSKKQDCALTAAQLGEEFAKQGMDYYAIEWYEKALHHDPDNESIDTACRGLRMKMALEDLERDR
jgi:tetratricopeptide (TPR) repeat protein